MSRLILVAYVPGRTVSLTVRHPETGQWWDFVQGKFVSFGGVPMDALAHTLSDPSGTGQYEGLFPLAAPGAYPIVLYDQAAPAFAAGDTAIGQGNAVWDGQDLLDPNWLHGLLAANQGVRNMVYESDDAKDPAGYDLCLYDTPAHAAANDGVTGLIGRYHLENTFDLFGRIATETVEKVS